MRLLAKPVLKTDIQICLIHRRRKVSNIGGGGKV